MIGLLMYVMLVCVIKCWGDELEFSLSLLLYGDLGWFGFRGSG